MRAIYALLLMPLAALAESSRIQRTHFYCLSNLAKLGNAALRPVGNKEGRGFVLAKVDHTGKKGYYLIDMGTSNDSTISFLDSRILSALKNPDVSESLPSELLKVLRADATGKASAGSAAEGAKFARPVSVLNEDAFENLSQSVITVLKAQGPSAKESMPEECHAFGDIVAQLPDPAPAVNSTAPAASLKK